MSTRIFGINLMNFKYHPQNEFYSELTMENITNSDYRHAQRVFKTFNNKNLGDYHDLYVQSDALLLCDVFENFRNQCLKIYDLDTAHYVTLPGLAWDCCLRTTNIKLDLITDHEMLLMIEEGIRGGLTQVITKYSEANNKYMENYDQNKGSSYLQYLDVNSLYAWAMCNKLPVKNFDCCKDLKYINQKFIKNYDENSSEKGYILEVDVEYQKKLQDEHKDLTFLPQKVKINKQKKLTCNLYDKTRYVIHIKLLQQALKHELKVKKVHRVIEIDQEAWMKKYIELNIELRKKASNDFEKDFFKLMCNVVFGKTMQNVRFQRDIKLVTTNIQN